MAWQYPCFLVEYAKRQPLADGINVWRKYMELIRTVKGDSFCLIEFVRDDDTNQFLKDAIALNREQCLISELKNIILHRML